jgi:serine/threonine protein kinase
VSHLAEPSNILVTPVGGVKLLDFGIAKLLEVEGGDTGTLTDLGHRALTPEFAAPEQV